jgi:flavin-dependent dehydrogenase
MAHAMYDAIVIGARCAGAATAMLLARSGREVLLVDRARFGSDIPHGHFIHRHGPRRLHDWGLLDRILATNCPPITQFTSDMGDFPLTGTDLAVDGIPLGLGPRRSTLDAVLVEAAIEAGAEYRDSNAVKQLQFDGDRVTGIDGEQARIVIGADGRNSGVAKQVGAPVTYEKPAVSVWYFSYWSGVPDPGISVLVRDRTAVFAFPTNDDLFAVFIAWPLTELARVKRDIEAAMYAVIDATPGLGERIRAGTREERIYGATQLPNFVRRPFGPGWALVGDAGVHKDPFMALGVCDALRDAELLAEDIDDLPAYERHRNAATMQDFDSNFGAAHLVAPPDMLAFRQTLRGAQAATNRFYLEREGMLA